MPIVPNFVEKTIFLLLNQGPGPVLDIWNAVAFRTVLAAIRLDVFEALASKPMNTAELAQCLNADARGVQRLIDALEPLGYVKRQGDGYANTARHATCTSGSSTSRKSCVIFKKR